MKSFGHPDPLQDARRMLTMSAIQTSIPEESLPWFIDARDHGLLMDDSTADQDVAINAAIAAAIAANIDTVLLPPGTCRINGPIILNNAVTLQGCEDFNTILKCMTSDAGIQIYDSGNMCGGNVRNIMIQGNSTSEIGLLLNAATESTFDSVVVINCTQISLKITADYGNNVFRRCVFTNNVTAIYLDNATHAQFVDCTISNSTSVAIDVKTAYKITFARCWCENHLVFFNFDGSTGVVNANGITLADCYFLSTQGSSGDTCRLVKISVSNGSQACNVRALSIERNFILLTHAEVFFDVLFNGGSYSNRIRATIRNNDIHDGSSPATAWLRTNMSGNDAHLTVLFDHNDYGFVSVANQTGTGGTIYTALAHTGPIPLLETENTFTDRQTINATETGNALYASNTVQTAEDVSAIYGLAVSYASSAYVTSGTFAASLNSYLAGISVTYHHALLAQLLYNYTSGHTLTVTDAATIYATSPSVAGTTPTINITTLYGLRIGKQAIAGLSPTTTYDLYISGEDVSVGTSKYGIFIGGISGAATNNYSLYTNAGLVHLGDNLLIGTTTDGLTAGGSIAITHDLDHRGTKAGFYGVGPIARPATGGAAATFAQGSGNALNDASTFDGYTLAQVVKALRNLGLLT